MSMTDALDAPQTDATSDHDHEEIVTKAGLIKIYATLALVVVLWGLAIATWGVPGLYMPAVAAVPVIFAILLVISTG